MTLTVRLDGPLDMALTRYCKETGVSKSLVVQESLAAYLLGAARSPVGAAAATLPTSNNHRAFANAGLIGAIADGRAADKAAVRERARSRQKPLQPKSPRQP